MCDVWCRSGTVQCLYRQLVTSRTSVASSVSGRPGTGPCLYESSGSTIRRRLKAATDSSRLRYVLHLQLFIPFSAFQFVNVWLRPETLLTQHLEKYFTIVRKTYINDALCIAVGDGGRGVREATCPPKIREKIFFWQLLCKIWAFFEQKSCEIREFC